MKGPANTRARWILSGGGLLWFAATSAHAGAPVLFEHQDGIFGTQPCNGGGCYTRYLRVADLDGDDDLDIVFPNSGFNAEPLVVYENDGSGGFSDNSAAVGGYSGQVRQVAIGDIDGDGDLDLYAPSGGAGDGALFINDGDGGFSNEGAMRLPDQPFGAGSTRMGDVDDDGDLDIVIADTGFSGNAAVYLNDGDGTFTELADAIPFDIGGDINDVDLFDVDRDFDLDLMTNEHGGTNRIWINEGDGTFTDSAFASSGGLHYGPGVCDVDGDGDLDIWIDNQGPGYTERLWTNDGNGTFTDVTVAQVSNNPGSDDNGIVCVDADDDGDMDAVVVSLGTPERLLVNDGAGNFTYQAGAFEGPTDSSLWAEMGDLDGDGRLDIVTGQGESGSFVNRVHFGTGNVPVDSTPPRIIVTEEAPTGTLEAGEVAVTHYAVSDNALSDMGPRLARAYAEVDPDGAALEVPASFMGGDLFRVGLPSEGVGGVVTYRLCAEDRQGNAACSDDMEYDAGEGGVTSDSESDAGPDGDGPDGDGPDGDGPDDGQADDTMDSADTTGDGPGDGPATTAGNTTPGGDGGSDGSDGTSSAGQDDDAGGCSCRTAQRSPWGLLLLLLPLALRRRRA